MARIDQKADPADQRKAALMAFAQAFSRESHHLMDDPDQTWSLLFNRLQWEKGLVQDRLAPQLSARKRPWIRTWSPHAESGTLIRTIPAHAGAALACAVSPDGYTFASGGKDGTLKLWDAANGKQRFTLQGHDGWVTTCAFSPDSRLLLSGSWDKTLKIWDVSTGQEIATLEGHTDRVNDVAFNVFGSYILSAGEDGTLILWDFPLKRDPLVLNDHGKPVTGCTFSPDSRFFLSAGEDGTLRIWGKDNIILDDHEGKVQDCAISPDGRFIVSIGSNLTLRIWRRNGRWQSSILNPEPRFLVDDRCTISPDGRLIATWSTLLGDTIRIWSVWDENELVKLEGHGGSVGDCAFTPDGSQLLTACSDGNLKTWDVHAMQREVREGSSKSTRLTRSGLLGWSERHEQVAATIETWAAPREKQGSIKIGSLGNKLSGALSPDERFLIPVEQERSGRTRKKSELWDRESGKKSAVHGKLPFAFSPDGRIIVANDDGHLHAWNPASGKTIFRTESKHAVSDCVVSPDGRRVLSSDGGLLRLWDLQTGELDSSAPVMEGGARCTFSPDGRFILTSRAGNILIALTAITGVTLTWGYLPWSIRLDHAHPLHPFFASGPEEDARLVEVCGIDYLPPLLTPVVMKEGPALTCPLCREPFPYEESYAGKTIACPNPACKATLAVNADTPAQDTAPDQAELAALAQELQACLSRGDDLRLLEILDRIEEAEPFVPAFKLSRAEALIRLARYKEAIAFLEKVKKLNWLEERDDESLATYLEGVAYEGLGDGYIMGADGAMRQADARYKWAWWNKDDDARDVEKGFAEMRLRRFQRAEALLRPLAEREPPYPRACYGLGLALLSQEKREGCAWIERFLQDPGDADGREIEQAGNIHNALCRKE